MMSTKENEYQRESRHKIMEFINVASKTEATKNLYFISECWQAQAVEKAGVHCPRLARSPILSLRQTAEKTFQNHAQGANVSPPPEGQF